MTSLPAGIVPRDALSAKVLHDLRTPLNQIIGYSEMLSEQAQEEGKPGFVPDLQEIRTSARQMLALLINSVSALPEEVLQAGRSSTAAAPGKPRIEPQTGAMAEPSESGAAQVLILVVDDNHRNRDMLSRRLERQGYGVTLAENGRLAMEAVRAQAFDLVLLDIMMPEMDGYEVLQQLKADEALRHIPVIMISALDEIDSVVRCIQMGAEDYLLKPFDPTLLKARTVACLERKRAHDRESRFTKELQESNRRAQELEQMRDDLTNMIVHDLRTPLTSVISGLQTLQVIGELNDTQKEMLDISLVGGETVLGMINDLLDISKMESGSLQLELTEISPTDLVGSALKQVATLANSKGLQLHTEIGPALRPITADGDMLLRTLVNLLSNAIKFTPSGGVIKVAARQSEGGQSLLWSVSDTGEGISPEAFGRIFEKFGQVETRTAGRKNSTGLGLTFCKLVVEAHGGRIWVESVPGEGSVFSFTILPDSRGCCAEIAPSGKIRSCSPSGGVAS